MKGSLNGVTTEAHPLLWDKGRISINVKGEQYRAMGPSGISLRIDDRQRVERLYERDRASGMQIIRGPEDTRVAYSFTALDPDGNRWWVNAESGFLDELRS